MKLKDFIKGLNEMYPLENKEIWDPSGYSVKFNQAKKLRGVILAIDLTSETIQAAIQNDCNLILTHHPFYFEATKQAEKEKSPYKLELHKLLKEHQITAFAMHTNYDCDSKGTSYQIAKFLGLEDYVKTDSQKFSAELEGYPFTINNLTKLFNKRLGFESFRTNVKQSFWDKTFPRIAILSGSGYIGQINDLHFNNTDLIITSDFRWSDWINFKELNINILEVPHLDEEVFAFHMQKLLSAKFPKEKFIVIKTKEPYQNITIK
ncbi:Nif3-like dinuclear metal center hexameric protein [Mycoplasmopsis glycophila]|uniref:GTP cyclohydrolase 1 type 2 homolog n=1 Tax=Mycoplasmopsis glycophila TaxID=171285 RepID=A0A449AUR6_9BACT|nr:Nif3-like dinuclear metal center hexameric protein [Mycoplasmopsis glycophila]VEU70236.1 Uncharacterized protein conserved in bacteria [Mycoplasmopsis glycophila]